MKMHKVFPLLTIVIVSALGGCIGLPKKPTGNPKNYHPPDTGKFAWGISTSSYQYENPDVTKGENKYFSTDWDIMVKQHGAPKKGNALYSWTEFEKDLAALKEIGATHYRFSIEWARIEPRPGVYDEKAIAQYVRMTRALKDAGIEPVVCLWHFTFPHWLYDTKHPTYSNWLHPDYPARWQAYVNRMVHAFGPKIRFYAPQNEPNGQITTAYLVGQWPPRQVLNFGNYKKAIIASAEQFRAAAKIIKKYNPHAIVMSVEALPWWKKSPIDFGNKIYDEMEHNNFDHLDRTYDVCDIIGFNYYYSQVSGPMTYLLAGTHKGPHYTMMGWTIDPKGLYKQIKVVSARYGRPMMITENGIATKDDKQRIKYINDHIGMILLAKKQGYDVRGYFVWSLADNYEWHYGYTANFGLGAMDPKTYERELRPSAYFYRDVIRQNGRNIALPEVKKRKKYSNSTPLM
ncbi:MAG: family 1 glycosylhydrolase [Chthoniobacterales bacterium]